MNEKKVFLRISKDVLWHRIHGKMILIKKESGDHYALNEVGEMTWNALVEKKEIQDSVDNIARTFSIHRDKVAMDTERFLNNLVDEKIIEMTAKDDA